MNRCILAFLLLLASAAAPAANIEDMAAFERLYIPALALTNQPQQPAERVAASLHRLERAWPRLRVALTAEDHAIERAARVTDRALPVAAALLAEGKRAQAHEVLEEIRGAFLEARREAGIELYVDRLSEFHGPMEALARLVEGEAGPDQASAALQQASGLWTRAERPRFDGALFGFDDAKYALLRTRLQAERDILDALGQALERGERAQARELAKKLKSSFAQIYVMFGDF